VSDDDVDFDDFMEDSGAECPECGYLSPSIQVENLGKCERCRMKE
jgi:hypothetical protein